MGKRYAGLDGFTISEVAQKLEADYGKVDVLIHSLANGPEVIKPLLETSRRGYLAASSASAYSMVSLVQKFAPIMNEGGGVISLTYIASTTACTPWAWCRRWPWRRSPRIDALLRVCTRESDLGQRQGNGLYTCGEPC